MKSFLEFKSIQKRYGPVTALQPFNFGITSGRVIALLGPNGAGKSTLLGCLLGLIQPTSGEILFEGKRLCERDRARFAYVPERLVLYPHRTVWENGMFFARLKNQNAEELERQLKRVALYEFKTRKTRQLSKGMLQRLGLAIALCGRPDLLVLDEPFNGLDPVLLETFQEILREELARGATIIIATHSISAVEPLATDVVLLLDGQLAAAGSLDALRSAFCEPSLEKIYHRIARGEVVPHEIATAAKATLPASVREAAGTAPTAVDLPRFGSTTLQPALLPQSDENYLANCR